MPAVSVPVTLQQLAPCNPFSAFRVLLATAIRIAVAFVGGLLLVAVSVSAAASTTSAAAAAAAAVSATSAP